MGNGILPEGARSTPRPPGREPPSRSASAARGDDELRRLVEAGLAEMVGHASLDPRVSDIVRRSGLSNKAFYRHFKSKDELLLAVLEEMMQLRVAEFSARLDAALPPLERVRAWIWGVLDYALDPRLSALQRPLLVHQGRLLESLSDALWSHAAHLVGLLQAAIEAAQRRGDLAPDVDPARDAEVIYHLAMGWMHGRVIGRVTPDRGEAERVVEYAMRGLGVRCS